MQKPEIWIIWFEIPQYGASILNYLTEFYSIKLFAKFSKLPINLVLHSSIEIYTNEIPDLNNCRFLLSCGAFTPYLKRVKKIIKKNSIPVIDMADNNHLELPLKKAIKKLLVVHKRDTLLMVPGNSGKKLATELGFRNIGVGMYGCAEAKSAECRQRI